MKRYIITIFILVCVYLVRPLSALAEADWRAQSTIDLNKIPVDIVMSANEKYLYILTDDSIIQVFDSSGRFKGKMKIEKHIDKITAGAKDNLLILTSKTDTKVQIISVEFIRQYKSNDPAIGYNQWPKFRADK